MCNIHDVLEKGKQQGLCSLPVVCGAVTSGQSPLQPRLPDLRALEWEAGWHLTSQYLPVCVHVLPLWAHLPRQPAELAASPQSRL